MKETSTCSILILGRDASLKQAYLSSLFLDKYWKDCPFPKYLCTQKLAPEDNRYDEIIYTNENMNWGERLNQSLKVINSEYVILCPEDDFLQSKVNTVEIQKIIEFARENNVGAIRLCPPMLFSKEYNEDYMIIPKEAIYRFVLHPMLFRTEYLRRFSDKKFNPWQFERDGSKLSRNYDEKILCTRTKVYDSVHAWSTGRWTREGYKMLKSNNVPADLYDFAGVYPFWKRVVDEIKIVIIKLFPHIINNMQMTRNGTDRKKMKL